MTDFHFTPLIPRLPDTTEYDLVTTTGITPATFNGHELLEVDASVLTLLADRCFHDVNHYLSATHLAQWRAILDDAESSENDRAVARSLLENAVIAAKGVLPTCQDTGTAIIHGHKGEGVLVAGDDEEALARGVFDCYTRDNLRYSQNAPLTMYDEANTRCNLPAQIDIHAVKGAAYELLCVCKGGGSANKSFLFQETRATLSRERLVPFLAGKILGLGTAACPPYHIAVVVGGTSAEKTMETVKLASTGYYDGLPRHGSAGGGAFRDETLEAELLAACRASGIGAQFGGRHFALDVRVVRLPRHGASLPIGVGVSCSAHRNIRAKVTRDGAFVEHLERHPERFLPDVTVGRELAPAPRVDLDVPMPEILRQLDARRVRDRVLLTGTVVVARDIAHARLAATLRETGSLPAYIREHPVYYAGPAKTPAGCPSGSFGPTTSARMDPYVDEFQRHGGSLVMIAKGNRSAAVTEACRRNGGFYLGTTGGAAALLAERNITSVEVLDYADLGMEAVWRIRVVDMPAFVLVDNKGHDFFAEIGGACAACGRCGPVGEHAQQEQQVS